MTYFCCDQERRDALQEGNVNLNGIDYLDVVDAGPADEDRQRALVVHFLNDKHLDALKDEPRYFRIEGGERIRGIEPESVASEPGDPQAIRVVLTERGDFSRYVLRLLAPMVDGEIAFDPVLSSLEFSFKVDCPAEFDCRDIHECVPAPRIEPRLDYLAKDYATFRRLMLDRLALSMPRLKEKNPAGVVAMLTELMAYIADRLSYQQDAIGTEAYIGTARSRISVRRHARLVDYFMHDGCNARAWVHLHVNKDRVEVQAETPLLTSMVRQPVRIPEADYAEALKQNPEVFEVMRDAVLRKAHNRIRFYTWGDRRCCLPAGATRATLVDDGPAGRLRLRPGDVLIFQEEVGPATGAPEDADPAHRHAVRLTQVEPAVGADVRKDPLTGQAVMEIEWHSDDALPFSLCISTRTDVDHGDRYIDDVSVALGNIVLVDHGMRVGPEALPAVPPARSIRSLADAQGPCDRPSRRPVAGRFRPSLSQRPLTHIAPYDPTDAAARALAGDVRKAVPVIHLVQREAVSPTSWMPVRDLLDSGVDDEHFVVEVEHDGTAFLRFARAKHPDPGTVFDASYRLGNGVDGNVGAGAIGHIVTDKEGIDHVTNPIPARGGVEPESVEAVRRAAPVAFRRQERAVAEADYVAMTERHNEAPRAAATFRWTGSWHTVFVTADRRGGRAVDERFEQEIRRHLEPYRMAGYDLEVDGPIPVSLELDMDVCLARDYFRSDIKRALLRLFSNGTLPDGRPALFHPDGFTFGTPVYLSPLYAAAQAIPGVTSVKITTFQRLGRPDRQPLEQGRLDIGRLEIARLDNDPNYPERGVFRLNVGGGR